MSQQEAKRLMEDVLAKDGLAEQLQEMDLAGAAEVARGLGYDVTAEELGAEVEERRAAAADKPVALTEEELDRVAGGGAWLGEDAPDGHEMGCYVTYHGEQWQRENNISCSRVHWCYNGPIGSL